MCFNCFYKLFFKKSYKIIYILKSKYDNKRKLIFIIENNKYFVHFGIIKDKILINKDKMNKIIKFYLNYNNYYLFFCNEII